MIKFKALGVVIKINILFPAMFLILNTTDQSGIALTCLFASIFHEIGHLIMLALVGGRPEKIEFGFFGMSITQNRAYPLNYNRSRLVSLAGPLVNLLIAAGFYFLLKAREDSLDAYFYFTVIAVNFSLGAFNLLPIEPLDGGQFVYSTLLKKMPEERADKIILMTSLITLVPIATAGFYLMIKSGYNLSLVLVSLYLAFLIVLKRKGFLNNS